MNTFTSISAILNKMDEIMATSVQGIYTALVPTAVNIAAICFALWFAFFGIRMIMGRQSDGTIYEITVGISKIVFIIALATEWTYFQFFIYDVFTNSGNAFAGKILSATAADTAEVTQSLDIFYQNAMQAAKNVLDGARSFDFSSYFYAGIIMLGAFAVGIYATFLLILSKLAIAILLALAPLVLLLLIFNNTRGFFEGWFRQVVNYAIIPLLVYVLLALLLNLSQEISTELLRVTETQEGKIQAITSFFLISAISLLVLMQIMNIASGIAGGFALSTMGGAARAFKATARHATPLTATVWNRGSSLTASQSRKAANYVRGRLIGGSA